MFPLLWVLVQHKKYTMKFEILQTKKKRSWHSHNYKFFSCPHSSISVFLLFSYIKPIHTCLTLSLYFKPVSNNPTINLGILFSKKSRHLQTTGTNIIHQVSSLNLLSILAFFSSCSASFFLNHI